MSQQVHAGVDVSADSFAVAYEIPGQALQEARMDNSAAEHRKLCRLLTRGGRPARVCLEATGGIRWNRQWVNVSITCVGEYVGLEEIDDGIWNVYFGPLKLGCLLEKHM